MMTQKFDPLAESMWAEVFEQDRLSAPEELEEAKRRGEICGICKGICLVDEGVVCCHQMVRYSECSNHPHWLEGATR